MTTSGAPTLAILSRAGVPLKRTDRDGTVEVRTDGTKWEVGGSRPSTRGPPAQADASVKASKSRPSSGGAADLNAASRSELEALPGIGPVLAGRIIEGRPYQAVDDMKRVKGIGAKRLEELRPLVRAR